MKIKCEIDGHVCELPDFMVDFFVHTTVIYCSTLSPNQKPHIHPVIFINEVNSCTLIYLVDKQLDESNEAVQTCASSLQEKYGLSTVTRIIRIDTAQQFVRVRVHQFKIVYWKNPYFKQFRCP